MHPDYTYFPVLPGLPLPFYLPTLQKEGQKGSVCVTLGTKQNKKAKVFLPET